MEVILQVDPDENLANYIKIIELDVERTFFEKDIEKSRKVINKFNSIKINKFLFFIFNLKPKISFRPSQPF